MLDAERVVRLLDGLGQVGRALVSDEEDAGEAGRAAATTELTSYDPCRARARQEQLALATG